MKSLRNLFLAALAFALLPVAASAQTVTRQPSFISPAVNGGWLDLGNGPLEVQPMDGNGFIYSSLGTGLGSTSGSSTTLTLTATAAANPPCVGCIISGTGITSGTTVSAFNGTTGITLSAAMTVAASTPLAWGVACPTSGAASAGVAGVGSSPPVTLRGGVGGAIPFYTQARICGYAGQQGGLTAVTFAIGAH